MLSSKSQNNQEDIPPSPADNNKAEVCCLMLEADKFSRLILLLINILVEHSIELPKELYAQIQLCSTKHKVIYGPFVSQNKKISASSNPQQSFKPQTSNSDKDQKVERPSPQPNISEQHDSDRSQSGQQKSKKVNKSIKDNIQVQYMGRARQFQEEGFDPYKDIERSAIIVDYWNKELQQCRSLYLNIILMELDKCCRQVSGNWQFNKIKFEPYIQKTIKLLETKLELAQETSKTIKQLHSYLKYLLGYHNSQLQINAKENDQNLSNNQPVLQKKRENGKIRQNLAYVSMLKADKCDFEAICANLKKHNIYCVIKTPFQKIYNLKRVANASVIYHNVRFQQLFALTKDNKDFKFGNRYLLVILITPYIRLIERNKDNQMNENDLKSLGVWLNREYPRETLSLWQFINENDELEYYISTGTKKSSLYIHLVMKQFKEKSSFMNPKGLEKLSEERREKRFKKIYTTGNA